MQNRDISHFQSGMSDTERASKKKSAIDELYHMHRVCVLIITGYKFLCCKYANMHCDNYNLSLGTVSFMQTTTDFLKCIMHGCV